MIEFQGASASLVHRLGTPLALDTAVELVIGEDQRAGLGGFSLAKTQIVRIPPPRGGGPSFFCFFPPNREDRPFNSGEDGGAEDPLSMEAARRNGQSFFVIACGALRLLLLANPYGYAERCVTWPAVEEIEQSAAGSGAAPWRDLVEAMLLLCIALGGDIVGFNALAGNSMRRLHFVSHRQPRGIGPYAMQQAAAGASTAALQSVLHIGRHDEYPIDSWRFGFANRADTAAAAAGLIERWHSTGGPFATVTVAATVEAGTPVLYVAPRNRLLCPFGWPGMPAVMEVMGVGVTSRSEFVSRVRAGGWGHENYRQFLASLRPHGVEQLY